MSEREPPSPTSAPRSIQAGAATQHHAVSASALRATPAAGYGASHPAGLDLCFGSITPELASASARRGQVRETRAAELASAPSSRAPAAPAAPIPPPCKPTAVDLTGLDPIEVLPPPPALKAGDRPVRAGDAARTEISCSGKVSLAPPRLRSIIVAPLKNPADSRPEILDDSNGNWQEVRPKFWWRKVPHSSSGGRRREPSRRTVPSTVLTRFKGLCFRCLSPLHFVRSCSEKVRCIECKRQGHIGRNCTAKGFKATTGPPPPPPLPRLAGPLQANAAAWPALRGAAAPAMARASSPGHPSNRPDEVFSLSISTPAMERAATEMRRTHLAILISDPRLNISTRSIAKAIQDELNFDWGDIHVSASFPDDFLVKFTHPWQRDMALEKGSIPLRRGAMALTTWSPTARGRPQTWRYYCRVAIESLPLNAWTDEDTVKAILDGGCELDRIEQRSVLQDNTAALFAWVWSLDPDLIPCVKAHSILDRPAVGRADLPEGTPAEEGRDGPLYRVLIHLDTIIDYSPIDESRRKRGYAWPSKTRREWEFGTKDNALGSRRRPGRDRLGPSNHRRDDDRDDRRDDRDGRRGERRSSRHGGDRGGDGNSSRWSADDQHSRRGADRHDRRASRSPDYRRRGGSSRHRSRSPSLMQAAMTAAGDAGKGLATEPHGPRPLILPPVLARTPRGRRSPSRTPEGSNAMGSTPSPPPGPDRHMCLSSPMQASPPPSLEEGHYMICSPNTEHFDRSANGLLAPPSPQIPWAALTEAQQPFVEANAYADSWSANIVEINQPALVPDASLGLMDMAGWTGLPMESSGEHDPSMQALQSWCGTWQDEPSPGVLANTDRLFGPSCEEPGQSLLDQRCGTPIKEKTVYEINEFCALLEPVSAGWQLQDIFATPQQHTQQQFGSPAPQQPPSSPELSSDIDDDKLFEVTLKSNALRALRQAELCGPAPAEDDRSGAELADNGMHGPATMEEVTSRVAEMHVDPKTGIMSKLMGMFSPSLLGFPTNSARKKKSDAKKSFQMPTSSRRSERAATKTSTMMTTRRAQIAACKQLGLIQCDDDFTDEVLGQYLALYRQPLSTADLHGLATLTEVADRPNFVLPERDMVELLKESPYAT
ncbi:hypothetical protein QYE76_070324 [Lolium multiflorum]|uniref:CCHC-type domain-containing protein n=1 Tax=Lolium multiflorum TaxID=4521 RepID=A0AAD8WFR6_LOLMU|nr:hypothetical protein QYE76_070324 [Lolium multiflorum]